MLVNAVGFIAEAAYHHPDLTVTYAKLWIKLQTHSHGGITDKDLPWHRKLRNWHCIDPATAGGNPNKFVKTEK